MAAAIRQITSLSGVEEVEKKCIFISLLTLFFTPSLHLNLTHFLCVRRPPLLDCTQRSLVHAPLDNNDDETFEDRQRQREKFSTN
jgi:hypothetical protein